MKYLKIFLLFIICQPAFCQDGHLPVNEQNQVVYSDLASPGLTKDELYKKAQNWIIKTFGNYENAVTQQDPQSGKLVINSYVPAIHSLYDYIRFDLTIECSDNQYRASIDQLDGTSPIRTPIRISSKENDVVTEKSVAMKTETNRKKRVEAEQRWQTAIADNEGVNNAMYKMLAGLKEYMADEGQ